MPISLIRNATLIDGTGAAPLRDAAVLVKDGRIEQAGPRENIAVPPGAIDLDAGGGFILPGFIDARSRSSVPAMSSNPGCISCSRASISPAT